LVHNLFESHVDDIRISDIEGFLADAEEDEGLNWEAKCDDPRGLDALSKKDIRKAVCAFANGRVTGVVLIGAEYDKGAKAWRLPGLRKPPTIPLRRWLDQVISEGLTPAPEHELRTFRAAPGRGPVAILRIRPLGIKPAVTSSGGIYVRTMTQSMPLKDPALIADLFQEGEAAQERAQKLAERLIAPPMVPEALTGLVSRSIGYRICVCPVGVPDDLWTRVFGRRFADETLPEELKSAYRRGEWTARIYVRPTSDRLIAWFDDNERVVAEVLREGAIAVSGLPPSEYDPSQAIALLDRGFDRERGLLERLADVLGLTGPALVSYAVFSGARFALCDQWTDGAPTPTLEDVAGAVRDLKRGYGVPEWEPH
jgi:hypothetical protein